DRSTRWFVVVGTSLAPTRTAFEARWRTARLRQHLRAAPVGWPSPGRRGPRIRSRRTRPHSRLRTRTVAAGGTPRPGELARIQPRSEESYRIARHSRGA